MKKFLYLFLVIFSVCVLSAANSFATKSSYISADKIRIGDIIIFGHYPQEVSGDDNTEIRWIVYKLSGTKAFLLSEKILSMRYFNDKGRPTTWKNCSLRKWLNSDFMKIAFTKDEQKQLIKIKHENSQDLVYLLTYKEVLEIFGEQYTHYTAKGNRLYMNNQIDAERTEYAIIEIRLDHLSEEERRNYKVDEKTNRKYSWWTCTKSSSKKEEIILIYGRQTSDYETRYPDQYGGVRPIIQIDLDKADYEVVFDLGGIELLAGHFKLCWGMPKSEVIRKYASLRDPIKASTDPDITVLETDSFTDDKNPVVFRFYFANDKLSSFEVYFKENINAKSTEYLKNAFNKYAEEFRTTFGLRLRKAVYENAMNGDFTENPEGDCYVWTTVSSIIIMSEENRLISFSAR